MKRISKIFLCLLCTCGCLSTAYAQKVASYQESQIECLATEMDGSVTLRVTGTGKNKADAQEQAKKNAVYAVIFEGIRDGKKGADYRPILTEVNARERYEEYFNIFFADGGEYKKYVSMADSKRYSKEKASNKLYKSYRLTVRVLRSKLKARLKEDNVLKH